MPAPVSVRYVGPSQIVYVPDLGAEVKRGIDTDMPADVAGHVPGDWAPRSDDTPAGWPTRLGADGSTVETRDPGAGLLAQEGYWEATPAAAKTPTTKPQEG